MDLENNNSDNELRNRIVSESSQDWVFDLIRPLKSNRRYQASTTAENTYDLIKKGYDIDEIAKMRNLKVGTITRHIISLSLSGKEIPHTLVDKNIPLDQQMKIIKVLKENGSFSKKAVRNALANKYTYSQIDLVIALMISYNRK